MLSKFLERKRQIEGRLTKLKRIKQSHSKAKKELLKFKQKDEQVNASLVELQVQLTWLAYNERKYPWMRNLK